MGGKSINWTEYDHLLGMESDDKIGREIGCASSSVRKRRLVLGIEPHGPIKIKVRAPKIRWHLWDNKIWTTSDSKLAKQIGCQTWTVTRRREELGKPAFRGDSRFKRDEDWVSVDPLYEVRFSRWLFVQVMHRAREDIKKTTKILNRRSARTGNQKSSRISGEIRSDDQVSALYVSTIRWFESEDDYPASFVWICRVLDTPENRFRVGEIRQEMRELAVLHEAAA